MMGGFFQRFKASWLKSTFLQKCRRIFLLLSLFTWIVVLIDIFLSLGLSKLTLDRFAQKISNIMMALLLPFGLLRGFHQPDISDGVVVYLLYVFIAGTFLGILTKTCSRPHLINITVLLLLIQMQSLRHSKVHCAFLAVALLIFVYNATFGEHGYMSLHIVAPDQTLNDDIIAHIRGMVYLGFALAAVYYQTQAYMTSVTSVERAVAVAKAVSEHLAEYNTKAAEKVLQRYAVLNGHDRELHTTLSLIVHNLKRYKPFLPNYIVGGYESSSSSPGAGGGDEGDDNNNNNTNNNDELEDVMEDASNNDKVDVESRPNAVVPFSAPTPSQPQDGSSRKPSLLAMIPTSRLVSYTLLQFNVRTDDIIDNPQTLRAFIDKAYQYANATNGAIHSCIANTIHLTWNATRPVVAPQRCAIGTFRCFQERFRLNDSTRTLSSRVEVYGSVMTGPGECRMTGTVHQTFLLRIDWRDAQQALHRYARTVKTNVVCRDTAKEIPDSVVLVDVVEKNVEIYEYVEPAVHRVFHNTFTSLLKTCGQGYYDEALKTLELLALEGADTPKCLPTLLQKIQFCKSHKLSFSMTDPYQSVT